MKLNNSIQFLKELLLVISKNIHLQVKTITTYVLSDEEIKKYQSSRINRMIRHCSKSWPTANGMRAWR